MARQPKKKAGADIADEFDREMFDILARHPDLVRGFREIAAERGTTFEDEVRHIKDRARQWWKLYGQLPTARHQ